MVVLNNDYIFLPKTKKDDSRISSKDTDDTIRIQARKNVLLYIRNIFGEPICKDKENIVFKIIYTYEMEIKNTMYEVIFTIYNIPIWCKSSIKFSSICHLKVTEVASNNIASIPLTPFSKHPLVFHHVLCHHLVNLIFLYTHL